MTAISRHHEMVEHMRRHVELRAAAAQQNGPGEVGQEPEDQEDGDTAAGG